MYSHHSRQYLTRSVLQPRVVYLPFESLKNYCSKYARRNIYTFSLGSYIRILRIQIFNYYFISYIVSQLGLLLCKNWIILTENSNFSFIISFQIPQIPCLLIPHSKIRIRATLESNLFPTHETIHLLLHNYVDIQIEKKFGTLYRNIA